MQIFKLKLLIFMLLNTFKTYLCFNYDTSAPVFKQINTNINIDLNDNDIYFGYSIAQHFQKKDKQPFILVGAPKDTFKSFNMSGAIYKCPFNLNRIDDCEQISVDFTSQLNSDESSRKYSDSTLLDQFKSRLFENQWFGVSLSSTGYGAFSACAHKYVHYYNFSKRDEHASYGACYTFNNEFEQEYKHVPCLLYSHETKIFYSNNYGYCQAGTSLLMTEGSNLGDSTSDSSQDTFMSFGMPSALNFRGLIGVRNKKKTEFIYGNGSDLCQFDIETDMPKKKGYCGNLWDKSSYLGMSHTLIQRYLNKEKESLIAAGAPRDDLFGVVRFFTITYDAQFGGPVTRRLAQVLKGVQQGSYFGFSIASCDVNGDKMSDLIVGAPYFSRKHEPNSGAIYVYLNNKLKGFTDSYVFNFTGQIRSLFGHSISCVGDIDKDGFMDFAVGAPYETNVDKQSTEINPSTGAVYIFRGGSDSIKLSQKIIAKQIKLPSTQIITNRLHGFGYSLSGGLDMDSNTYPDLAVGVLNSNSILVLRTQPVVSIKTSIINYDNIQDLDQKQCDYNTKCFTIDYCIELNDSLSITQTVPLLNYSIEAEQGNVYSRVYFTVTNTSRFNSTAKFLLNTNKYCSGLNVLFKKDAYDFLTPIKFLFSYNFISDRENISRLSMDDIDKHPIVHEDSNKFEFEANFKKECGPDNKCLTDLKLNAEFLNLTISDDNVTLISFKESDTLSILVRLENNKQNESEPAYATQINVLIDKRLDFIKKEDLSMNSFSCAINYKNETDSTSLLQCKMTSESSSIPFSANHSVEFILTFSSTRLYRYGNITSKPDLKFILYVSTLSTDINLMNNQVILLARLKVRANLFLYGTKTPEQLFYGDDSVEIKGESAMKSLEEIGPIIEHTYKINNAGPFSVNFFQLIVDWPHETRLEDPLNQLKQGKHLLYLIEKPTKIPNNHPINVVCSSYEVDPLKLSENKIKKRSIENEVEKIAITEIPSSRTEIIDCFLGNAFCHKIICNFYGNLNKGETISLKFTARVWNATLVEDFGQYEKVLIRSFGRLILSDDILDDKPSDNENSVTTLAYSNVRFKSEKVLSMWVYVLSVMIGLVLLIMCTIGFWMIGFFERKKFGDDKYLEDNEKLKKTPY